MSSDNPKPPIWWPHARIPWFSPSSADLAKAENLLVVELPHCSRALTYDEAMASLPSEDRELVRDIAGLCMQDEKDGTLKGRELFRKLLKEKRWNYWQGLKISKLVRHTAIKAKAAGRV